MRLLLMLMAFLPSVSVFAAEVYRWTDANGQVHFSQRPPAADAEKIELPDSGSTGAPVDQTAAERRDRQRRVLESYEYEREQKKRAAAKAEQEDRDRAAKCADLERSWRSLSHGGPIYYRGENGERDYLSEQQRTAEKEELRAYYQRYCGGEL